MVSIKVHLDSGIKTLINVEQLKQFLWRYFAALCKHCLFSRTKTNNTFPHPTSLLSTILNNTKTNNMTTGKNQTNAKNPIGPYKTKETKRKKVRSTQVSNAILMSMVPSMTI